MMGKSSPASSAISKKLWLSSSRLGRPKEMLETPNRVRQPSCSLTMRIAFSVSTTSFCCTEAVRVILENYGFPVIDLGRDVPAERVVQAVREHGIRLVGLSALMTTTLKSMEETIALLHQQQPDCKIMVGGAPVTDQFARTIGADAYTRDAASAADVAAGFLA